MTHALLLIEDSRSARAMVVAEMEDAGFSVSQAASLSEAEKLVAEFGADFFDAALVDHTLPDAEDGQAIFWTIGQEIPTIVYSGNADPEVNRRLVDQGALDFILKTDLGSLKYLRRQANRVIRNPDCTVLVVEDNKAFGKMIKSLLQRYRLNVLSVSSAEEALLEIEERRDVDLLLVDHLLPEMSGLQLTARLREKRAPEDLGIIGLSGSSDDTIPIGFLKAGADDFLAKPIVPEILYRRVANILETMERLRELRYAAMHDFLTTLYNRRTFMEVGRKLVAANRRSKVAQAVAILDVDHFKRVNDTYGHDAGDKVLREVASVLKGLAVRGEDVLGRLGGEEFGIIIRVPEPANVAPYMERIRSAIEATDFRTDDDARLSITISIGVVISQDGDLETMMNAADRRLYAAKNAGRNRVDIEPTLTPGT